MAKFECMQKLIKRLRSDLPGLALKANQMACLFLSKSFKKLLLIYAY